jgi:serine/threonine protein kinase
VSAPADPERERFARVGDLFHHALALSDADRVLLLERLARDEPDLAAEVAALVNAHHRASDFIEQPAFRPSAVEGPSGARGPIGHYRVLSVIGVGGMGIVYLAEDTRLGRTVALKAVRTEFADDERRVARLRREARAAATLTHPNVATVYALEEIDGHLYVASEFVGGQSLRDELDRGPLPPARVVTIALAIARALAVAHEHGVVHRDLKPENVVTTPRGDIKVLDFGLAQFADPDGNDGAKTAEGAVMGTPGYMSPEQIRGLTVDGRSDLFALGVIVYELATGQHPFRGPTSAATIARVLESRAPSLSNALPPDASADPDVAVLTTLVARSLEKRPDDRFASAQEVVTLLETARSQAPGLHDSKTPRLHDSLVTPSSWWWQFHQAATTLAYVLLLIPVWRVRAMTDGPMGMGFFVTGLVAVVVAGMLRLHLWFALRQYPGEWFNDHHIARQLIRAADVIFVLVLAARGFTAIRIDDPSAALLIAAAASVAVSSLVIEPATTRAMGGMKS